MPRPGWPMSAVDRRPDTGRATDLQPVEKAPRRGGRGADQPPGMAEVPRGGPGLDACGQHDGREVLGHLAQAGRARSDGATTAARPGRRSHRPAGAGWLGAATSCPARSTAPPRWPPRPAGRPHRDIGDHPAVDEDPAPASHRGQDSGNGSAGQQHGLQISVVEQRLTAGNPGHCCI